MDSPRLYVGNLPYVAQPSDVEKLFEDNCIPVKNIDISIDPFTGRNPSYCFVDFHTQQDAVRALEVIGGQEIRRLFKNFNVQAISKMISPAAVTKTKPRDHYHCFVDLVTLEDAQQAELALDGQATPYGGRYRVANANKLPSKPIREQLGGFWPGSEVVPQERNLEGNWRRVDCQEA